MNNIDKKTLLIIASALVGLVVLVGIIFYILSFRSVHFDIKKDVRVIVYRADEQEEDKQLASLEESGNIRLQEGNYIALPEGDNYDEKAIEFSVEDIDMTVTIDPSYSSGYLNQLLAEEISATSKAINDAYPDIIKDFQISRGELYKEGQWYATTLIEKMPRRSEQGDVYRVVLKKEEDTWKLQTTPALTLSTVDYPDIPRDILSSVNRKPWEQIQ